ncbi:MAG: hypothetical protein AMJ59_27205 [Gammaproteobacteria bacterium SG8_31]|nr:MAG: hypothetical protein AMJ59_27205 [Gammaproteobacteria bacterium SG8_31]
MLLKKFLLITCLAFIASPAAAAYLTVGCGGDYPTITAAVTAAGNYDTITVCPGDYDESVFIENKEGLTIQSTEIAEKGPNTIVNRFNIGFAPNNGPHSVTIKGFTLNGPTGGPCLESSGDYTTFAHNTVKSGCNYGIRVNEGNYANNVHHNYVRDTNLAGITVEGGGGFNHNVHQNRVKDVGGEGCYYVWADFTEVHQNEAIGTCGNGGLNANGSEGLHFHHNVICYADVELFGADYAYVHHNQLTGEINNANSNDTLKKNRENLSSCPLW